MKRGATLVTNGYHGFALASKHPGFSRRLWPFAILCICTTLCAFEVAGDLHSKVRPIFLLLGLVIRVSRRAGSSAT